MTSPPDSPQPGEPEEQRPEITLSAEEARAVIEATVAFAGAVPPGRDAPYRRLVEVVDSDGSVDGDDIDTLERVCALALETGKARQLGLAESERLLTGVYRRTPAGRAELVETADVNRALGELVGRELQQAKLTWKLPGRYQLDIGVDSFSVSLVVGHDGVHVQSLQAG